MGVRYRRLKKAALLVGCVLPGASLMCGDELAKSKYHRKGELTMFPVPNKRATTTQDRVTACDVRPEIGGSDER